MTEETKQDDLKDSGPIIGNASEIIERFGGLRPMATKTRIPVTTIQGWKQRNAIPANRRDELIEAANDHGIKLGELLMDIAGQDIGLDKEDDKNLKQAQIREIRAQRSDPDLRPANNQSVLLAAGALILVAAIGGGILAIVPKLTHVQEQEIRIQELEQQIASMKNAQESVLAEEQAAEMRAKLQAMEDKVGSLTEQAKSYTSVVDDVKSGNIVGRLAGVESQIGGLVQNMNAQGLQNILLKFESMQASPDGAGQMDGLLSTFLGVAGNGNVEDLTASFAGLKASNPQIAETFKDVAPEDMKAAVMLLGMTQLRSSLARDNQSFDKDLEILKMTMAKDNPELQAAIDRLVPKAKSGVLTPSGLSNQLRGLTGDIVSASLLGQEISIEDRAKARFGDVLKIEKNGARISGTSTQITIAEAQKKLDTGDIAGAVSLLQQIQGPAAEKTQPIIDAAQATMLASQVKDLVGKNIVQTLKGLGHKSAPYAGGSGGMDQIMNQVKSIANGLGAQQ